MLPIAFVFVNLDQFLRNSFTVRRIAVPINRLKVVVIDLLLLSCFE
mgnify:CR=1 FL=1